MNRLNSNYVLLGLLVGGAFGQLASFVFGDLFVKFVGEGQPFVMTVFFYLLAHGPFIIVGAVLGGVIGLVLSLSRSAKLRAASHS